MFFASSISATDRRIDTGRVAFALACSSSALRTAGFVRGMRDPDERTSVPSFSARSNSRCVCRRPSGLAYQSVSSVLDLDSWSLVDFRGIDSSLSLIHGMSRNRPQSFIPNREHYDQPSSRRCTEKLPSFLAADVFCRDDRVGPLDRFLDFRRVDSMSGNMADIVQIPIEALKAIQHSHSIYNFCIYSKATFSRRFENRRALGEWLGRGPHAGRCLRHPFPGGRVARRKGGLVFQQ